jgi:ATP-dependent DNA helicase RecG
VYCRYIRSLRDLTRKTSGKTISAALSGYGQGITDELPEYIIQSRELLAKKDAVRLIHQPETIVDVQEARPHAHL